MRGSKVVIWLVGALIVASVAAGWIAIGRLAAATARGMARTEESLESARELASNTSASATELQRVIGVVGEGLASTGDALVATRQVSTNVRGLLDTVSFFDRVDSLSNSLKEAEASIANVEIDLAEAAGSVEEAGPVLDSTIAALRTIPNQIEVSIGRVKASRAGVVQQVWLWRAAMAASGAALLLMLVLIHRVAACVNWGPVAGRPSSTSGEGQP